MRHDEDTKGPRLAYRNQGLIRASSPTILGARDHLRASFCESHREPFVMINAHLPPSVGVGFKPEHFDGIAETPGPLGFIEIHAENYMGAGGLPHAMLEHLRATYALSIHGVGLSIGGAGPLDQHHLQRLKALCDRYEPASFSEHLAWSTHDGAYLNDLLPLPYTEETLAHIIRHIDEVQSTLNRQMLLENPSTYVQFKESTIPETEFLKTIAERTGCRLLLDVNNVFVSSTNHALDPRAYLNAFPLQHVGEIHLGGHTEDADDEGALLLIDAHGSLTADPVWALYAETIAKTGPIATLIEWDNDVPAWPLLRQETARAYDILTQFRAQHAA